MKHLKKYAHSLVIPTCLVLSLAGMAEPGALRWVLLAVAAVLALLLARRSLASDKR